jgi:hypothetical protein
MAAGSVYGKRHPKSQVTNKSVAVIYDDADRREAVRDNDEGKVENEMPVSAVQIASFGAVVSRVESAWVEKQ